MEPGVLLSVRGLAKSFPGVLALDNVSLDVAPGEVHALVGENGAGKSTLIKVLTGVYPADSGAVVWDGAEVSFHQPLDAQRAGISTIYQEVNLIPLMSVARNLFLGREPRNRLGLIDLARMNREAASTLSTLGVNVDPSRPLRSLGLGAQQMVALARALAIDAKLLILDEPTSCLEPREVETLFDVVRSLDRIGVIYVSHRLDELYRLCHRVTMLRDGKVVHCGPLAGLDKLALISHMLGRKVTDERRTRLTRDHDAAGPPVLSASGLTKRPVICDISLEIRPGEVLGLAGLLGSGRSETAKAIAGALPLDAGTVTLDGKRLKRLTTANAIEAGMALLPEDRKAGGSSRNCRCGRTSCSPRCPGSPRRAGSPGGARTPSCAPS